MRASVLQVIGKDCSSEEELGEGIRGDPTGEVTVVEGGVGVDPVGIYVIRGQLFTFVSIGRFVVICTRQKTQS